MSWEANIYSKYTQKLTQHKVCVWWGENELATEMELNGKLNEMNGWNEFLIVAIMVDNISVLCCGLLFI